jgi:hypothetical protein
MKTNSFSSQNALHFIRGAIGVPVISSNKAEKILGNMEICILIKSKKVSGKHNTQVWRN